VIKGESFRLTRFYNALSKNVLKFEVAESKLTFRTIWAGAGGSMGVVRSQVQRAHR
jgi:hypothetical protein